MLFLERRTGQAIVVDDVIKITIVDITESEKDGRRKVRLAFDYPEGHTVFREEIVDPKKREEFRHREQERMVEIRQRASAQMKGVKL